MEKIAAAFKGFQDIPGYARCVSLDEIVDAANDFNLNVRRYVDNSPPPELHDVRAHLVGGVPTTQVDSQRSLFEAIGFGPDRAFTAHASDPQYLDFVATLTTWSVIGPLVAEDAGAQARRTTVRDALAVWWQGHTGHLVGLNSGRRTISMRCVRSC